MAKSVGLTSRGKKVLIGVVTLFFLFLIVKRSQSRYDAKVNFSVEEESYYSPEYAPSLTKAMRKEVKNYKAFFKDWDNYKPTSPSLKDQYIAGKAPEIFANDDSFLFSKSYLERVLDIPLSTFKELKTLHQRYVNEFMNKVVKKYQISSFSNILDSDPEWTTYKGSRGIVLIGGGKYNWLSYLVIRQLRATGSQLPIELFIPSEGEYEEKFCNLISRKYNARCNVCDNSLMDMLREKFDVGGFQYKLIALLTSKFENLIYIDSDNFPTSNVDHLFESDLYNENGLVLWPDAWGRTTNPKFYDISGTEVVEEKVRYSAYDKKQAEAGGSSQLKDLKDYSFENSKFHDFKGTLPDPTTEAGVLMVNKTTHLRTLLLALYYNIFGPKYYYPLLTQGSAGEGDKETFMAAANVVHEPWFQTPKQFKWCGYISEVTGKFTAKSLGHYDPDQAVADPNNAKILFMHLSYPKFYPEWLADNHDLVYQSSGNHIRMYKDVYSDAGYDFDLRVLQFFVEGLCPEFYNNEGESSIDGKVHNKRDQYMGNYLKYVKNDDITAKRCKEIFLPHFKWLLSTTEYPDSLNYL